MLRQLLFWATFGLLTSLPAQVPDSSRALQVNSSISLPMSRQQILEHASDAWKVSFGREIGAVITAVDAEQHAIHSEGHFNFRSDMLVGREETMGRVRYTVKIEARNGECRTSVGPFVHRGNHNGIRPGVDMGTVPVAGRPTGPTPGMSGRSAGKVMNEVRELAFKKAQQLIRSFEGQLRIQGQDR
ncbi:MAG: hypothetical protein KDB88_08530 [Flavobacteriales bacterium]|nr:hypothetical protein [Flavobacteriales bacterium]